MKRCVLVAALLLTCAVSALQADERALNLPIGDPARKDREAAVVLDGITDAARGDTLTPPELAARLDGVNLLFVGESHTDIEFHDVQLRVIRELHEPVIPSPDPRGTRVALSNDLSRRPLPRDVRALSSAPREGLGEGLFISSRFHAERRGILRDPSGR